MINTIAGTAIMFGLYNLAGCSYWFSSAANYILASILSYWLNRRFTFRYRGGVMKSGVKFALNIGICYIIAYGAAKPFAERILEGASQGIVENVAMAVGMCIFTGLNYTGQRFFVFGERNMDYRKNYEKWAKSPYITDEERAALASMNEEEREDAFYKNAEFGTAGMRGKMGLGTNRLNKYTVRMAAGGLAALLGRGARVAIAYDVRNNSADLAAEAARVLAKAGIKVCIFDRYSPVPLLSFAVRDMGCDGGIVITASHNTKEYNGFKVYDRTGCQLEPDMAAKIAGFMENMEEPLNVPVCDSLEDENIETIGDEEINRFLAAVEKCSAGVDRKLCKELRVVYTPLHGSGRDYVLETLQRAGFENIFTVKEQMDFDGNFPTVKKPNPEEPEALSMAGKLLLSEKADILIGTDPDSDRIGVGVRIGNEVRYLTGNETGILLVDFLARMKGGKGKKLITTIVTSQMASVIAESYGADVRRTLTGFKFIGGEINEIDEKSLLMGYEESYGYLVGPHARDKDGISAALVICQMAAWYRERGQTLAEALESLYEEHGHWIDRQESFVFEGSEGEKRIKGIMSALERDGKNIFGKSGNIRRVLDYNRGLDGLVPSNVLKYLFDNGSWIAVRPSGTEPKIKFYYSVMGDDRIAARDMCTGIEKAVHDIVDDL